MNIMVIIYHTVENAHNFLLLHFVGYCSARRHRGDLYIKNVWIGAVRTQQKERGKHTFSSPHSLLITILVQRVRFNAKTELGAESFYVFLPKLFFGYFTRTHLLFFFIWISPISQLLAKPTGKYYTYYNQISIRVYTYNTFYYYL